jgi:hypothetical protein
MNLPAIFKIKRCEKPKDGIFSYVDNDPVFMKYDKGKKVTFQVKGSHYIEETYRDGELICGQGWLSPTEKITI